MSQTIEKLTELFTKFPGIGPRQARRFVYYLLTRHNGFIEELVKHLLDLKKEIHQCEKCQRYFSKDREQKLCSICRDQNRESSILLVVSRDIDLENIEKAKTYSGQYFVLGGSVPILEKEPEKKIRLTKLKALVLEHTKSAPLAEIILAMNANPEGENTADYLKEALSPLAEKHKFKISLLGRGLSTGTELEYSDQETIRNALKNRG